MGLRCAARVCALLWPASRCARVAGICRAAHASVITSRTESMVWRYLIPSKLVSDACLSNSEAEWYTDAVLTTERAPTIPNAVRIEWCMVSTRDDIVFISGIYCRWFAICPSGTGIKMAGRALLCSVFIAVWIPGCDRLSDGGILNSFKFLHNSLEPIRLCSDILRRACPYCSADAPCGFALLPEFVR